MELVRVRVKVKVKVRGWVKNYGYECPHKERTTSVYMCFGVVLPLMQAG